MRSISKKQIKEISSTSFIHDVIIEKSGKLFYSDFLNDNPEQWTDQEKFDLKMEFWNSIKPI